MRDYELERLVMEKMGCDCCPHYNKCFDDNFEPCDNYLKIEEQIKEQHKAPTRKEKDNFLGDK